MTFSTFGLDAALERSVLDLGFSTPTPIQMDAIPPAMLGRDVLACAMTGSGKTAAFVLPILHKLIAKPRGVTRALVVTPTRELAAQVADHLRQLATHTRIRGAAIFGGVGMRPQEDAFRSGVDVLIATPGRLLDHLQHPYARLDKIEFLVLDEADRMLDMGFLPDIRRVLRHVPKERQTLFFSATMPPPIAELAREMLRQPVSVNIERQAMPATGITQAVYPVSQELKSQLLLTLLKRGEIGNVLVFTRTKHRANRLAEFLGRQGVVCDRIHGNRSQVQRTAALASFKTGRIKVLVATDIAARGIDVEDLSHVVNFDVPNVPEDYIHRVGRTARAEATGDAFTFVSQAENDDLAAIEKAISRRLPRITVPDFDYTKKADAALEIPIGERIAAIRARKSDERMRAREKAERKALVQLTARPQPQSAGRSQIALPAPQPSRPAFFQRPPAAGPRSRSMSSPGPRRTQ